MKIFQSLVLVSAVFAQGKSRGKGGKGKTAQKGGKGRKGSRGRAQSLSYKDRMEIEI